MKTYGHRQSIRLKGRDYSEAGMYFVTVCTQDQESLFGEIRDGEMRLNEWGEIVRDEGLRTAPSRPYVTLDEFTVMPNHFHGILVLNQNAHPPVGARRASPLGTNAKLAT